MERLKSWLIFLVITGAIAVCICYLARTDDTREPYEFPKIKIGDEIEVNGEVIVNA